MRESDMLGNSTQLKNISRFPWTTVIKYEELSQQGSE